MLRYPPWKLASSDDRCTLEYPVRPSGSADTYLERGIGLAFQLTYAVPPGTLKVQVYALCSLRPPSEEYVLCCEGDPTLIYTNVSPESFTASTCTPKSRFSSFHADTGDADCGVSEDNPGQSPSTASHPTRSRVNCFQSILGPTVTSCVLPRVAYASVLTAFVSL